MNDHIAPQIDALVEQVRQDWKIPGIAVSMVRDGAVAFAKGYGVRAAGSTEQVDGDTLFPIGSCTKSFTAAALAMLVDEGKIAWDDPLRRHRPDFAVADEWMSAHITVRDLLAHRLGLQRATPLYTSLQYSQSELIERMRYYEPLVDFRSEFSYDNAQYTLAGALVEAVSGQTWRDFVRERIFSRLAMQRSQTCCADAASLDNRSGGHTLIPQGMLVNSSTMIGDVVEVPWQNIGNEPAGSIVSSARELGAWLLMLLSQGQYADKSLIQLATLAQLHQPQTVSIHVDQSPFAPLYLLGSPTHFWSYGLGFYIIDYRGHKMIIGGGQIRGMNSLFVLLPELNAGYSILVNVNSTAAHFAISNGIADVLIGGARRDWNQELLGLARMVEQGEQAQLDSMIAARQADVPPTQPISAYAGLYQHRLYGRAYVEMQGDQAKVRYGAGYIGRLEHWSGDTYIARWEDLALVPSFVTFESDSAVSMTIAEIGKFERIKT
jgi:CubicO group peptidase (beta-lactamase class C family)